jgi:uncharacterized protein YxjI
MVVRCPKCGMTQMASAACKGCGAALSSMATAAAPLRAPARPAQRPEAAADPAFGLDRYLFKQRVLTVSEKYDIQDENGSPLLFVERPAHALRNIGALLAGVVAAFAVGTLVFWTADQLPRSLQNGIPAVVAIFTLGLGLPFVLLIVVVSALGKKRDIACYRDDSKKERLLEVRQDQKFSWFTPTFTVADAEGRILAHINKNLLVEVFRKKWIIRDPSGTVILVAKEDSIVRALLRRLVSKLVLLNFILCRGESDEVIGEFNKNFSLRDRYVLDLTRDRARTLDRRIAVAVGVLLDTGERR